MKIKFEMGKADYKVELQSLVKAEVLGYRPGRNIPLMVVPIEEMRKIQAGLPKLRAFPVHVALDAAKGVVWFHPTPNGEFTAVLQEGLPTEERDSPPGTLHLPKKQPVTLPGEKPKGTLERLGAALKAKPPEK